jgi:hypothetical protein
MFRAKKRKTLDAHIANPYNNIGAGVAEWHTQRT